MKLPVSTLAVAVLLAALVAMMWFLLPYRAPLFTVRHSPFLTPAFIAFSQASLSENHSISSEIQLSFNKRLPTWPASAVDQCARKYFLDHNFLLRQAAVSVMASMETIERRELYTNQLISGLRDPEVFVQYAAVGGLLHSWGDRARIRAALAGALEDDKIDADVRGMIREFLDDSSAPNQRMHGAATAPNRTTLPSAPPGDAGR